MEASHIGRREADVAPASQAPARAFWGPADPAALGLAGFALTTFILGFVNTGAVSGKDVFIALSVAGAYGGLAQLLAGMWAYAERNLFAATAFTSYGAFWISFVLLIQFFGPEASKAGALPFDHGLALYLFCWGFFTLYMWFASFRVSVAVNLVFLTLWIAYVLLGIGLLGAGHPTITKIGGIVTCVCAATAWYTAAAIVINGTLDRVVLPVIPLTKLLGPAARG
jgi:succinate-acetate transporter protein